METTLTDLLKTFEIEENKIVNNTVNKLSDTQIVNDLLKKIDIIKNQILDLFNMQRDIEEFYDEHITIPNANAKKNYEYRFDLEKFPNIIISDIRNLDSVGLVFDQATMIISGIPTNANTIELDLVFYNKIDETQKEEVKTIPFIVNADPKDLWKNLPSDQTQKYAKADNDSFYGDFLDKKIVIASKRGRSHAHEGSFREDHFKTKNLPLNWYIIAVADGAGSAKFSRQGSKIATESIVSNLSNENDLERLSDLIETYYTNDNPLNTKSEIINILYKAVRNVHTELNDFATKSEIQLKDFSTTLIFTLAKKFDFGYIILNFGVGDCPINLISKNLDKVDLLNTLDVGDFGGGTRFITMPEIFNETMASRFGISKYDDFSKLVLMTDGIYDAKFVTENQLEKIETWKHFIADLEGENEDHIKVDFLNTNGAIKEQLLDWMDFWSKGNHDDRTLAIIY